MNDNLKETAMLDFSSANVKSLVKQRGWNRLDEKEKVVEIYNFVKDEILFGYNVSDNIPASKVLQDGYGQCNTKGTLFMVLLRACNVECRIHCFYIDKILQKGAMTGFVYKKAPRDVLHSWVEVKCGGTTSKALFLTKPISKACAKSSKQTQTALLWATALRSRILTIPRCTSTIATPIFKARE